MSKKHNEGFTLVELLVTIVIASIVTMAATTVLLLGMRLNNSSASTAQRQNTVRIFMSVVEKMASEGEINSVTKDGNSWKIMDPEDNVLFRYDDAAKAIYTGGIPMMEELQGSTASLENQLLTVVIKTEDGEYKTSAYCRTGVDLAQSASFSWALVEENLQLTQTWSRSRTPIGLEPLGRLEFLEALYSQLGSTGTIQGNYAEATQTYAQWYDPSWDSDTAWCGCFLSWGLEQTAVRIQISTNDCYLRFADVKKAVAFFQDTDGWKDREVSPMPGDIIFFDWNGDKIPNHVGAVLAVKDGYVHTIEGNSSNRVVVSKYSVDDNRILGYGVLNWKD